MFECALTTPAQVRYIWPTRWSTVKVIYLYNRYWNLAVLAAANAQILGIWRGDSPEVRALVRAVRRASSFERACAVLLPCDAGALPSPILVVRGGAWCVRLLSPLSRALRVLMRC